MIFPRETKKKSQDHGQDQSGNSGIYKFLIFAAVLDLDVWFAKLVDDLEGKMLDSGLHSRIGEFTAGEAFDVEDAVRSGWRSGC